MLAPKLYYAYLSHVFLGGLDDLVVDDPLRLAVEERGGGVDRGDLAVHQGAVPLLRYWQGISQLYLLSSGTRTKDY